MKKNPKVLLVEDNEDDMALTTRIVKKGMKSASITQISGGEEAMVFLQVTKDKPDIIFLDIYMPKVNGFQVLAEIRKNPKLKGVPIVMLTSSEKDQDVLETYGLKANFYITKPISTDRLSTVLKALGRIWV